MLLLLVLLHQHPGGGFICGQQSRLGMGDAATAAVAATVATANVPPRLVLLLLLTLYCPQSEAACGCASHWSRPCSNRDASLVADASLMLGSTTPWQLQQVVLSTLLLQLLLNCLWQRCWA